MGIEMKATGVAVDGAIIPFEELLRVPEAAEMVGCSISTINKHIYFSPKLRSITAGSSRFVFRHEVLALKAEMEVGDDEHAAEYEEAGRRG